MEDFDFNKLLNNSNRLLNTANKAERFVRNTSNDINRINTLRDKTRSMQAIRLGQGYRSDLYPYYMNSPYHYGY